MGRLQWQVRVEVHAPLVEVWEAIEDVSLIPLYHPEVRQVELLSGSSRRAPGMSYKCIVPSGKRAGWCVEQVIEHVPLERTTVAFPSDSWGLSRLLGDFTTELSVAPAGAPDRTRVLLAARYRPQGWRSRVLNCLGLRWVMRRRARQTLERLRHLIEARHAGAAA
jgi:uncharacterized membrane protein